MAELLLQATHLVKRFGGVTAVDGVDLAIERNRLYCIIGPNGAGKSTLFNMLCGTARPTAGSIAFEGQDVTRFPDYLFARIGIARKFQVPSVFESMTVRDNLAVAFLGYDDRARTEQILQRLLLVELADLPAGELAHGQKQWLEIGMALMSQPKLLLLDEPTAGMSGEETHQTAGLLHSLVGDITIVAIEHDMRFVRDLDCHTMVMHQGQLIVEGRFSEIEDNEHVRDIYLGRQ